MISRIWSSTSRIVKLLLSPTSLGVAAQYFHADRVEGAEPRHAFDDLPHHLADAVFHLARGLVGEGDGEDFRRPRPPEIEDVRDARGEHAGLAGSRAGQHQHRPVQRLHRLALLGIEVGEIGRAALPERARGDAAGNRLRAQWAEVVTLGLGHLSGKGGFAADVLHAKMAFGGANFEAGARSCARLTPFSFMRIIFFRNPLSTFRAHALACFSSEKFNNSWGIL